MIIRFKLLRNIGQFDSVSPSQQISLSPFSLIYGENGRGKTTIAAILRSLSKNDPSLIQDRQRIGSQHPPHVVIEHSNGQSIFQNGSWNQPLTSMAIFDDAFVSANVCSGMEVQSAHRQGLHELILGSQGVQLNDTLMGLVRRTEEHNAALRELADAIPATARGSYKVDAFCSLNADEDIDTKIQSAERRLAAARSADAIRQRPGFLSISLPDFDIEAIDSVLSRCLGTLEAEAGDGVRAHLSKLGRGGETWISEGMPRIDPLAGDEEAEICPFCAQDLGGSQLIEHYRAYFSQAYEDLKAAILEAGISVRDAHSGEIRSAFERNIRVSVQAHEFWRDFADLPDLNIDTAAIARQWNTAREAVLGQLRAKASAPLEEMALTVEARKQILHFRAMIEAVAKLSGQLVAANSKLDIVKEQAQADNLAALNEDLSKLRAQKARFEPEVELHCKAYLAEKSAKSVTEESRKDARTALDQYRDQVFQTYEANINDYLRRFAASFRIGEVQSVNTRSGSSASYSVVINQQNVNVSADAGPSFKNTLSAGDRNTLALAFFFASLEQDNDLANKVLVIDDPMTSLDEHRTLRTRDEILAISKRVKQVIVLSHSKSFLCHLWEQANRNGSTAFRVNRGKSGSELAVWDVRHDSVSEHDKRHELARSYLAAADPAKERDVAAALRHMLEAFMRVACPEYFPPGKLLGPFISQCDQMLNTGNEILKAIDITELKALLRYANKFHHDTNPAWQTESINDTELVDFTERTLLFTSRG